MTSEALEALNARNRGLFGELLGLRITSATAERVTAELVVRDDLCTVPGVMHGGAIMAFADTLGGYATGMNLANGAGTTTIESKTNFFSAAAPGAKVIGECLPLHRGKRTMVWQTSVRAEDGRLIAQVTQTQIVIEPRRTPQEEIAALFEGKSEVERRALLASLERGGAAIYRAFAAEASDPAEREALLAAARREEENAELLERK